MSGESVTRQEPRGKELIKRYKEVYSISDDANISEEMILRHWELERRLRTQLLNSTAENRWKVFDRCYTELYSELDWLNNLIGSSVAVPPSQLYSFWPIIIGQPPKDIYEIGSGKGKLINFLASYGYKCKGTEITHERGRKHVSEHPNLSWGVSDGVHLDEFESDDTYDALISDQVVEHIHPDDLVEHFRCARSILRTGGRYIFATPHKFIGPSDISQIFECDNPMGMHLKEYSFKELRDLLRGAGFQNIAAMWKIPERIVRSLRTRSRPRYSRGYLSYLCIIEKLILLFPKRSYRRAAAFLFTLILFKPSIFIIAQK